MNVQTLHETSKAIATRNVFQSPGGAQITALQILAGQLLKKHRTDTPAFLLCIFGKVVFENVAGAQEILLPGDFVEIEPLVEHWVRAQEDSQLVLVK